MKKLHEILSQKQYLTVPELARILGISRIAVYKKVKKGQIHAIRIGRNFAIPTDYIKSHIADIEQTLRAEDELLQTKELMQKAFKDYGEVFKRLGKH